MPKRKARFSDDTRVFVDHTGTVTDGYAALPASVWSTRHKASKAALDAVPARGVVRVYAPNMGGCAGESVYQAADILRGMLKLDPSDFDTTHGQLDYSGDSFDIHGYGNAITNVRAASTIGASGTPALIYAQTNYIDACLDAGYSFYASKPSSTRTNVAEKPIGVFDGATFVGVIMPVRGPKGD